MEARPDPLEALYAAVGKECASGRIGRPVMARGEIEAVADHGRLLAILARALGAASGWLADVPERVLASGSLEAGHVAALIEGEKGTTCLLACGVLRQGPPTADLIVLGTNGAIRHEGPEDGIAVDYSAPPGAPEELSQAERSILRALEASLASGSPAAVAAPGKER